MPTTPTYPGVYIEELTSQVRTIIGVATSITAFVGRTRRGRVGTPVSISGFGDFEREFGGLWKGGDLGHTVRAFYLNGGGEAIVVRLYHRENGAEGVAKLTVGGLKLRAVSPGAWGNGLQAQVLPLDVEPGVAKEIADGLDVQPGDLFNLRVVDGDSGEEELFANVTVVPSARRIDQILAASSRLVRWDGSFPVPPPVVVPAPDDASRGRLLIAAAQARLAAAARYDQAKDAAGGAQNGALAEARGTLTTTKVTLARAKRSEAKWVQAACDRRKKGATKALEQAGADKARTEAAATAAKKELDEQTKDGGPLKTAQQKVADLEAAVPPDQGALAAAREERDQIQARADELRRRSEAADAAKADAAKAAEDAAAEGATATTGAEKAAVRAAAHDLPAARRGAGLPAEGATEDHRRAGRRRRGRPAPALRQLVHRDLRGLGGPVRRRPHRLPAGRGGGPARRPGHRERPHPQPDPHSAPGGGRHDRLPAA